ncbi:UNVERIFIED_CONTAM: hypothetical protein FKN15_006216 [Acipenser sinensis]
MASGQRAVMLTDAGCCQVINSPLEGTVVQQHPCFWNEGQLTLHGKEGSALCTETRTYLQESYLNIQNLCHLLSGYTEHHEGVEFLTRTHSKVAAVQLCGALPMRSPRPLHCPDTDPNRPVIRALNRNTAT